MEKKEIYKENFAEYLLCLALDVGEGMLRSGGEVSRVEDTIERICRAYGAVHVEAFSIISVITAAIRMPDGSYSSQIRRIKSTSNNLGMLEKYNALSRRICAEKPPLDSFDAQISQVKKSSFYHVSLIYLAYAFASGGFAVFFGASPKDAAVAFLMGAFIGLVEHIMPPKVNEMAKTVVSAFITSSMAMLAKTLGIADSADTVIIGVIMLLVPGVAFGTAMRDLLYGDLVAGTLKTLQAILVALMIAFGYMMAFALVDFLGIDLPPQTPSAFDGERFFKPMFFISSAGALIGSLSFAVVFKVAPRHLLWGGIAGLATYVIYYTVEFYTGGLAFPAAFISTLFTALFAEVFSRVRKAPTVVFLIPGVIPTVPGGALYRTMRALLMQDWSMAFDAFLYAIQVALGIAGGIVAISVIFGTVYEKIKKRKMLFK